MKLIKTSAILIKSLLVILISVQNGESKGTTDCFRAAVFEYVPIVKFGPFSMVTDDGRGHPYNISDAMQHINQNLDNFDRAAKVASDNEANIIVFPEMGIHHKYFVRVDEPNEFIEEIPDAGNGTTHNPCNEAEKYEKSKPILYRLSCMAQKYNIYVVANTNDFVYCDKESDILCPDDDHYQYNTNVVFDSNGFLTAKYHKMHVFYEYFGNHPNQPELVYFDTPFGRMGLYICFDLLYELPGTKLVFDHRVDTMIFTTFWFDELPFNFATQMQQSWAITHKVNLLASNEHYPNLGTMGSGIYSGSQGAIIYTYIPDTKSKLLIADLPTKSENRDAKCINNRFSEMVVFEEQLEQSKLYNHFNLNTDDIEFVRLSKQTDSLSVCRDGLCCHVDYSVKSSDTLSEESYFVVVANRTTGHALAQQHYPICEEICAVVRCDGDIYKECQTFPLNVKNTVFESIHISAKFSTVYTYPSVTASDLQLVPISYWNYISDGNIEHDVQLDLTGFDQPILTAGFYGRCFNRDKPYVQ